VLLAAGVAPMNHNSDNYKDKWNVVLSAELLRIQGALRGFLKNVAIAFALGLVCICL
jgi:hypothetical protein